MPSPRAWSYLTLLCLIPALTGCPTQPSATETDTGPTTGTQTETSATTTTMDCPVGALGCACTNGGVCDPGLVCAPDKTCAEETSTGEPSTGASSTTTDTTGTTTSDVSTTGPTTPCDPADGQPNLDCIEIDPNQPFCADAGVCGGCTVLSPELGCAQLDPEHPLCNPEDGHCVACTADDATMCTGDTPACDPLTNECTGCFEHSHCPDTACDILAGKCFPSDRIIHIRTGLPADGECTDKVPLGGTVDDPYCNATYAMMHAQKDGATSGWTFKWLPTDAAFYHGSVTALGVNADTPVSYAFVHAGPLLTHEDLELQYHTQFRAVEPVFTVGTNITAYIHNFGIFNQSLQSDVGVGLGCLEGANVFVDDSLIRDARGANIRGIGCNLHLRRTSVYKGRTEGIELDCSMRHCELHLENSFISDHGYVQGDGGGGMVLDNVTVDILYSTILNNNAEPDLNDPTARGDAIHCLGDNVDGTIRNSVIASKQMGNLLSIKCDPNQLAVTTTLLDSEAFKQGNHKTDAEQILGWFKSNGFTGAKLLKSKKEFEDDAAYELVTGQVAAWKKGDPLVDFDGHPRTVVKDGDPDIPGADVHAP